MSAELSKRDRALLKVEGERSPYAKAREDLALKQELRQIRDEEDANRAMKS